jgi:hypothetical protein
VLFSVALASISPDPEPRCARFTQTGGASNAYIRDGQQALLSRNNFLITIIIIKREKMPTRTSGNPSGSRPLSSSRLEHFPRNSLAQPYTHKQQHSSSIGSSSTSLLAKSAVLPPSNPETSHESAHSNHSHDNSQDDHEEAFIEPLSNFTIIWFWLY